VQVMQGRSSDPDRARELMANDPADWQEFRPDILGTVSVGHDGNAWHQGPERYSHVVILTR
jgi:hypothetical protein